jgi:hypothetical protein
MQRRYLCHDLFAPPSLSFPWQVHDESVPPDQFYGEGFEATFPADPPPAGIDSYGDISEGAGGHSGY